MDEIESLDINMPLDFVVAETIMREFYKNRKKARDVTEK
jgi:hypothetical protein